MRPGWYEILGEHGVGKTTLAAIMAMAFSKVLWLTTGQEYSPYVFEALGFEPTVRLVVRLDVVMETVESCQAHVDMIVVDSLASLRPTHSHARTIAPDLRKLWFVPSVPILVVNQARYPVPSGGLMWRAGLTGRYEIQMYRRLPALFSKVTPGEEWLVWWPSEGPKLRELKKEEKELWLPKGV